MEFVLLTSIRD